MSAERLVVGDRVRCPKCRRWYPADRESSRSATDYAVHLFIRCASSRIVCNDRLHLIFTPSAAAHVIACARLEWLVALIGGSYDRRQSWGGGRKNHSSASAACGMGRPS